MDYIHHTASPLGGITLASDGTALTGLWFDGQKYDRDILAARYEEKSLPIFEQTDDWLNTYFAGRIPQSTPPLAMRGTPFRRAVWEILLTISYGQTLSYGGIARILAARRGIAQMSAQAVGNAVAHNPISLLVPCHRVMGANGSLTGYAGGIDKKLRLLRLEGVDTSGFFVPAKGTAL